MNYGLHRDGDAVWVCMPYNAGFREFACDSGGEWDGSQRAWKFRRKQVREVVAAMDRHYGTVDGDDPSGEAFASLGPFGGAADDLYDVFNGDVGDR